MSIHHLEAAAELGLHSTTKLVLMALCDDANKITRVTFPGMEKLVQWSGAKPRRVQDIIQELIDAEYLIRRKAGQPGRKAEFLVFPTEEEIAAAEAKTAAKQPVDNPNSMGAAQCIHSNNGCTPVQNACTPECVPPVRPPLDLNQSSHTVTSSAPVDNSTATDQEISTQTTAPKPRPASRRALDLGKLATATHAVFRDVDLDQETLRAIALRILVKSPTEVLDETAYVSAAIRRESHYWQQQAFEIAVLEPLLGRAEAGGNPF